MDCRSSTFAVLFFCYFFISLVLGCPFAGQNRKSSGELNAVNVGPRATNSPQRRLLADAVCPPPAPVQFATRPVFARNVPQLQRQCFIDAISFQMDRINRQRLRDGENPVAADFLRMCFHDCAPGSCDASIIFNPSEFFQPQNKNIEASDHIGRIKNFVDRKCCKVGNRISWADTIVLSTCVGIYKQGGVDMRYTVRLGRRDRRRFDDVSRLPAASAGADTLIGNFQVIFKCSYGEAVKHLVALSGAHTIGDATCSTFLSRRETATLTPRLLNKMTENCPLDCLKQDFDMYTPTIFDNKYFQTLLDQEGLLTSDQALFADNNDTRAYVELFARDEAAFFAAFHESFLTLTELGM